MRSDRVVVVGAGPAGLEAARLTAELGTPVTLVEKKEVAGGMPIHADYAALTHHFRPASEAMAEMIDAVTSNALVDIRTGAEITAINESAGEFSIT